MNASTKPNRASRSADQGKRGHEGGSVHGQKNARTSPGFSIIELVIVVVILGIIAGIAMPRLSRASESAKENALLSDLTMLQGAIERYTAEHGGLSPGHDAPGSTGSEEDFAARLVARSDERGNVQASGYLGPYLRHMPPNPFNGLETVRIGGAAAGSNTHGWRFDPLTLAIQSDHGTAAGDLPDMDAGKDSVSAGGAKSAGGSAKGGPKGL